MPRCLLLLSLVLVSTARAAPAWTWVDEAGHRHFSDRPVPGATRIELPESRPARREPAQETAPAAAAAPAGSEVVEETDSESPAIVDYERFDIINPIHEQTLWNIGGTLPVEVRLQPPLQRGHQIDVVLDGQRMGLSSLSEQLSVPDVYRGLHTLQAVVVDSSSGQEILRSGSVTIMVQQTSILNPNNPNN
jgi:hypothetical protein